MHYVVRPTDSLSERKKNSYYTPNETTSQNLQTVTRDYRTKIDVLF